MNFRKEMLKNIRCSYTLYKKKLVTLQFNMRSRRQKTAQCKYNLYQHIKKLPCSRKRFGRLSAYLEVFVFSSCETKAQSIQYFGRSFICYCCRAKKTVWYSFLYQSIQ